MVRSIVRHGSFPSILAATLAACAPSPPATLPLDGGLRAATDEVEATWGTSASMPHMRIAGFDVHDVGRDYRPTEQTSRPLGSLIITRRDSAAWHYRLAGEQHDTAIVSIALSRRGTYRQELEGVQPPIRTLDEVTRVAARIQVPGDSAWRVEWSWRTGTQVPGRCEYAANAWSTSRELVVRPVPATVSLFAGCTVMASPQAEGLTLVDRDHEVAAVQVAATGLLARNRPRVWLPRASARERLTVAAVLGVLALKGIPWPVPE